MDGYLTAGAWGRENPQALRSSLFFSLCSAANLDDISGIAHLFAAWRKRTAQARHGHGRAPPAIRWLLWIATGGFLDCLGDGLD